MTFRSVDLGLKKAPNRDVPDRPSYGGASPSLSPRAAEENATVLAPILRAGSRTLADVGRWSPSQARSFSRVVPPVVLAAVGLIDAALVASVGAPWLAVLALVAGVALALWSSTEAEPAEGWRPADAAIEARRAALASFAALMAVVAVWLVFYGAPSTETGQAVLNWLVSVALVGAATIFLVGEFLAAILMAAHRRGGLRERVLLVGASSDVSAARRLVADRMSDRMRVVGALEEWPADDAAARLDALCAERDVDVIAYAPAAAAAREPNALQGFFAEIGCPSADVVALDGRAPWHLNPVTDALRRPTWAQLAWKRAADFSAALLFLAILSPPLLVIGVLVKVTSPGPVFFLQKRVGKNGQSFDIVKFRTMYADQCDPDAAKQTQDGDKRVTGVGYWLRKLSIDELPQIWNILKGEMSFIGPRPHAPGMLTEGRRCEEIVAGYDRRHAVKPGLTGLAQVEGFRGPAKTADHLEQRVAYDVEYIRTFSFWTDLAIAVRTAPAILFAKNAQ